MISKIPIYNLNAVRRETGLKADVLRAWERRYKLPMPQRSTGGHRLYSQYDIEIIKWLQARQGEGLSISRAVELWMEIIEAGRNPFADYSSVITPANTPLPAADTRIDIIRSQWLDACMNFDNEKAEDILNQSFALYPVEVVCTEVLQQGLKTVGDLWYSGKASVQQEHFASALAVRRIEALILAAPSPTRQQTAMLACPAGERHIFPLLLIYLFLRRKGFKVVYLGANVPMEQLKDTTTAIHPDVIVLSAQRLSSAASTKTTIEFLLDMNIPLAYGGLIFNRIPELRDRIPAWFLGENIEQAIQMVENLATKPLVFPSHGILTSSLGDVAKKFAEQRPFIEMTVHSELQNTPFESNFIGEADTFFASGLESALELGDPAFIEADLEWLNRFLHGRQLKVDQVNQYLLTYLYAVKRYMGTEGAVLTTWLDSYLSKGFRRLDEK